MVSQNVLPLFPDQPEPPQSSPPSAARAAVLSVQDLWNEDRPQRLLWVPVLWATGAGTYFSLPFEPPIVASAALVLISLACAFMSRRARPVLVFAGILLAGFAAAQAKTHSLRQPLVAEETRAYHTIATVTRVEKREDGGWRLHLHELSVPGDAVDLPDRVRLLVRTDVPDEIAVGQRVSLRAVFTPLPRPISPGGYDFGRNLYLDGYGATGFAVSRVTILGREPRSEKPSVLQRYRMAVDDAISASLTGDTAGLAKALLLGEKAELSLDVRDAYRRAGLAHLLAISGLHMALVAGFVFLLIRQGLALSPRLALQLPLKSIAAGVTIAALFGYLALVGAPVSAQRAVVMATCVMLAIIVGRSAISLRTAAIAAMGLLAFWPENIVDIGFQMSFVAVIALISGYEASSGVMARVKDRFGPRAGAVVTYFAGIVLSTVVAEIAVFPLSLYHFNEITVYGLLGNAVAVPITGFWIMPMGILGVLLTPLGLGEPAFLLMGLGLDLVTVVTRDIASTPGAFIAARSPSIAALLMFMAGGLWLCLWRSKLRMLALVPLVFAPFLAFHAKDPTILINAGASSIAVKSQEHGHVLLKGRRSGFAAQVWARQVGQTGFEDIKDTYQRCDTLGCSAYLHFTSSGEGVVVPLKAVTQKTSYHRLEIIRHPAALRDVCKPNTIVISPFELPARCANALQVLDEKTLDDYGPVAVTIRRKNSSSSQQPAASPSESASLVERPEVFIRYAYKPVRPWHPGHAHTTASTRAAEQ